MKLELALTHVNSDRSKDRFGSFQLYGVGGIQMMKNDVYFGE